MITNELNIGSVYDYFVYSRTHKEVYKLVVIITNKQVVISTDKGLRNDHWNMIASINKEIFPNRKYDEFNVSNDNIVITSSGSDLEVTIPDEVSEDQIQELKNILRQVKQFEYDYDYYLFIIGSPEEFLETAINNKKEKDSLDDDEEIIGTVIKSKKNK